MVRVIVEGSRYIVGVKLPAIQGRFVMPENALADFGIDGDEVGLLPALSYIAYHISRAGKGSGVGKFTGAYGPPCPVQVGQAVVNLLVVGRPIMMGNPGVNGALQVMRGSGHRPTILGSC